MLPHHIGVGARLAYLQSAQRETGGHARTCGAVCGRDGVAARIEGGRGAVGLVQLERELAGCLVAAAQHLRARKLDGGGRVFLAVGEGGDGGFVGRDGSLRADGLNGVPFGRKALLAYRVGGVRGQIFDGERGRGGQLCACDAVLERDGLRDGGSVRAFEHGLERARQRRALPVLRGDGERKRAARRSLGLGGVAGNLLCDGKVAKRFLHVDEVHAYGGIGDKRAFVHVPLPQAAALIAAGVDGVAVRDEGLRANLGDGERGVGIQPFDEQPLVVAQLHLGGARGVGFYVEVARGARCAVVCGARACVGAFRGVGRVIRIRAVVCGVRAGVACVRAVVRIGPVRSACVRVVRSACVGVVRSACSAAVARIRVSARARSAAVIRVRVPVRSCRADERDAFGRGGAVGQVAHGVERALLFLGRAACEQALHVHGEGVGGLLVARVAAHELCDAQRAGLLHVGEARRSRLRADHALGVLPLHDVVVVCVVGLLDGVAGALQKLACKKRLAALQRHGEAPLRIEYGLAGGDAAVRVGHRVVHGAGKGRARAVFKRHGEVERLVRVGLRARHLLGKGERAIEPARVRERERVGLLSRLDAARAIAFRSRAVVRRFRDGRLVSVRIGFPRGVGGAHRQSAYGDGLTRRQRDGRAALQGKLAVLVGRGNADGARAARVTACRQRVGKVARKRGAVCVCEPHREREGTCGIGAVALHLL